MVKRVYNFYPGPATLPETVLATAQEELLNYKGLGMSVMELSHRSAPIEELISTAEKNLKELLNIPEDYRVLFLQGGASTQFYMVPFNFLPEGKTANYVITGNFAEKAYKEAAKVGQVHVAASTKEENHTRIVTKEEIQLSNDAAYVHITSNNTIFGTQWQEFPEFAVPLVADMSSDILSRPFDVSKFDLIYAGAQKNLGPSGITVVIVSRKFLDISAEQNIPTMLKYATHAEKNSLYNTPPTFPIYMVNLVLEWLKEQGGVEKIEQQNKQKAQILYDVIDTSDGFYKGHAVKDRSMMNVTFRLPSEELEKRFVKEAEENGLVGLKGHRSVGGIRASIYNAMPVAGCEALADFMREFRKKA